MCVQLSTLFPSVSTRPANQLTNLFTESTSFQPTDATTKLEFSSGLTQEHPSNPTKGSEETTPELSSDSIQDSSTRTTDEFSTGSNEPTLFNLKALSTEFSSEAAQDFSSTSTEPLYRSSGASTHQQKTYFNEPTWQTHENHSPSAHDFSALSTEGTRSTENYSGPFIPHSTTDQQESRESSDWLSTDPMQGSTTPDLALGHRISSIEVASSNYYSTVQQQGTTDEALLGNTSDPSPVSLMTILSSVQTQRTSAYQDTTEHDALGSTHTDDFIGTEVSMHGHTTEISSEASQRIETYRSTDLQLTDSTEFGNAETATAFGSDSTIRNVMQSSDGYSSPLTKEYTTRSLQTSSTEFPGYTAAESTVLYHRGTTTDRISETEDQVYSGSTTEQAGSSNTEHGVSSGGLSSVTLDYLSTYDRSSSATSLWSTEDDHIRSTLEFTTELAAPSSTHPAISSSASDLSLGTSFSNGETTGITREPNIITDSLAGYSNSNTVPIFAHSTKEYTSASNRQSVSWTTEESSTGSDDYRSSSQSLAIELTDVPTENPFTERASPTNQALLTEGPYSDESEETSEYSTGIHYTAHEEYTTDPTYEHTSISQRHSTDFSSEATDNLFSSTQEANPPSSDYTAVTLHSSSVETTTEHSRSLGLSSILTTGDILLMPNRSSFSKLG